MHAQTYFNVSDLLRRGLPRSGSSLSIGGRGYSCDTLNWSDYCKHDSGVPLVLGLFMLRPNKFISSRTCWLIRSTETFMTVVEEDEPRIQCGTSQILGRAPLLLIWKRRPTRQITSRIQRHLTCRKERLTAEQCQDYHKTNKILAVTIIQTVTTDIMHPPHEYIHVEARGISIDLGNHVVPMAYCGCLAQ